MKRYRKRLEEDDVTKTEKRQEKERGTEKKLRDFDKVRK